MYILHSICMFYVVCILWRKIKNSISPTVLSFKIASEAQRKSRTHENAVPQPRAFMFVITSDLCVSQKGHGNTRRMGI